MARGTAALETAASGCRCTGHSCIGGTDALVTAAVRPWLHLKALLHWGQIGKGHAAALETAALGRQLHSGNISRGLSYITH